MRINAKEDRRFKATALALNAAKQSVKTSKQHMTALSMGNEPGEQEEESASIDPTRFLNHKESISGINYRNHRKEDISKRASKHLK